MEDELGMLLRQNERPHIIIVYRQCNSTEPPTTHQGKSMPYNDSYPVHLLPSSSSGRWRTARDIPSRRKIMEEIMKILLQSNITASNERSDWINTLHHKVKTIEISIYKCAPSLQAYCDTSNLPDVVQTLELCYERLQNPSLTATDTATAVSDEKYDELDEVHYLPSSSIGCWRTSRDLPYRRQILEELSIILKINDRETFTSLEWTKKVNTMLRLLELSLYKSAPSLESYCDLTTLRRRIGQLKVEILHHKPVNSTLKRKRFF